MGPLPLPTVNRLPSHVPARPSALPPPHPPAARLWNDVFNASQDMLRLPRGTVRATVLIETLLAAFEMEEILYELRDHSSGGWG